MTVAPPTPRRIVVLGTGTGIGKTHVSTLLVRALRAAGHAVLALKPIETGFGRAEEGVPPPGSDAEALELASGRAARPHPLLLYPRAVSPHLEAARLRTPIRVAQVARWVRARERDAARAGPRGNALHAVPCTVIESAGAVFSPLGPRSTNLDLARALEPALWLMVAPDALGVLHDVRATWTAMGAVGRLPDHLVLSASRPPDASTGTNARALPRVGLPSPSATVGRDASDPAVLTSLLTKLGLGLPDHSRGR